MAERFTQAPRLRLLLPALLLVLGLLVPCVVAAATPTAAPATTSAAIAVVPYLDSSQYLQLTAVSGRAALITPTPLPSTISLNRPIPAYVWTAVTPASPGKATIIGANDLTDTFHATGCAQTGASPCSLRDAVAYTNTVAPGSTIQLISGIYDLSRIAGRVGNFGGSLHLDRDVTIIGTGAYTTFISAEAADDRAFDIAPGVHVAMIGLMIQHASADGNGGAIRNRGTLALTNCNLHDNRANRNPAGNGGGIANEGSASVAFVTNSAVVNNQAAASGGGIYNEGTLALMNSTVSGNYTPTLGGGIAQASSDGSATATLTNVTLAYNQGASYSGLYVSGGRIDVANTIVSNAGTGFNVGIGNCYGAIVSRDYNLSSDASCGFTQPHDLTNTDPLLTGPALYGGATMTDSLRPGSPAIDAGGNAANGCPSMDQRGIARPQGAACDIGAFELT